MRRRTNRRQSGRRRQQTPIRNRAYLEAVEEVLITWDLRELGGTGTAMDLIRHVPMRYDPRHLGAALKRLAKRGGPLRTGHMQYRFGSRGLSYHLREMEDQGQEAKVA